MSAPTVVESLQEAAKQFDLTLSLRRHSASFCTVYLEAQTALPRVEQQVRLKQARDFLEARDVQAELTRFNNPPFRNPNTGKMEEGHHRHGDPLLEVETVWWKQ